MNATDRLVRSLYALPLDVEDQWEHFRALALENVCRALALPVGAWLTQVEDSSGPQEFTVYPADAAISPESVRHVDFKGQAVARLGKNRILPGTRNGIAVRHDHHDSRLVSVAAFGLETRTDVVEDVQRAVTHMVESSALMLRHVIQRDERLHQMGRSNRGASAVVDAGGTLYAASRSFREMLGRVTGSADLDRLPFPLPEAALEDPGTFGFRTLRFRASRLRGGLFQVYARPSQPLDELSPREQEIARALGAGKTFKSVAKQCGIAVSTVANHASRIYRKLGVYRREDLVQLVRQPAARQ